MISPGLLGFLGPNLCFKCLHILYAKFSFKRCDSSHWIAEFVWISKNLCLYTRRNFRDFVLTKKNPKQKGCVCVLGGGGEEVGIVAPLSIVIYNFVCSPCTIRLSTTDVPLHEYDWVRYWLSTTRERNPVIICCFEDMASKSSGEFPFYKNHTFLEFKPASFIPYLGQWWVMLSVRKYA